MHQAALLPLQGGDSGISSVLTRYRSGPPRASSFRHACSASNAASASLPQSHHISQPEACPAHPRGTGSFRVRAAATRGQTVDYSMECSTEGTAPSKVAMPTARASAVPIVSVPTSRGTDGSVTDAPLTPETNPVDAGVPDVAEASAGSPAATFNWFRHWWPLLSEEMFHKDKPNAVTLLGRQLVVWWSAPQHQWVVQEDSCPHRLTPLSQGRMVRPGELTCSYPGWSFNSQGTCTTIPHLPQRNGTTNLSKRSCVRTYPSRVAGGLLFAWMDNSLEGLDKMASQPLPLPSDPGPLLWAVLQAQGDCRYWLHQVFDPAHANFLHVGFFKSEDSVPLESPSIEGLSVEGGFTMKHGGYEKRNRGLKAVRKFVPPCTVKATYEYPSGLGGSSTLFFVPVQPGVCRTFISFGPGPPAGGDATQGAAGASDHSTQGAVGARHGGTAKGEADFSGAEEVRAGGKAAEQPAEGSKGAGGKSWVGQLQRYHGVATWLFSQAAKVPHWLYLAQTFPDQDVMAMYHAEKLMWERGLSDRDFFLATPADLGVAAVNKWLRLVGDYDQLWGDRSRAPPEANLEQLLDRRYRHTDHCAVCQKGLRTVERVSSLLHALSFASWGMASALVALWLVPDGPGSVVVPSAAAATGLAALLAILHGKVEDFKDFMFLSGMKAWRRAGGLSLVPAK